MIETNAVALLLLISGVIQFITAGYALWLIRITGIRSSWILIAVALFLMGVRRFLPFFSLVYHTSNNISMMNEVIGLVLSLCVLIGIRGVKSVFLHIRDSEKKIQTLLNEKELLLREVHHRIKNNMNTVFSLLSVQADAQREESSRQILLEAANRVQSMKVLYDRIYRSEVKSRISLSEYFPYLIEEITSIFPNRSRVSITTDLDNILLGERILSPLGIILNELITNAMKYAFSDNRSGHITVTARREGAVISLCIEDDGSGLPESIDIAQSPGFGLQLVYLLVHQIDGTVQVWRDHGTRFTINFTGDEENS